METKIFRSFSYTLTANVKTSAIYWQPPQFGERPDQHRTVVAWCCFERNWPTGSDVNLGGDTASKHHKTLLCLSSSRHMRRCVAVQAENSNNNKYTSATTSGDITIYVIKDHLVFGNHRHIHNRGIRDQINCFKIQNRPTTERHRRHVTACNRWVVAIAPSSRCTPHHTS